MKLIFCPLCEDLVRIHKEYSRACHCGVSWGQDDAGVLTSAGEVGGQAVLLAIDSNALDMAVKNSALTDERMTPSGRTFYGWVLRDRQGEKWT